MATDTLAMSLLIRLMPLMQREFALRIDPGVFFADEGYRDAVLSSAIDASEPRLRQYAEQLRVRLAAIGYGSPGALRSTANSLRPPHGEPALPDFDRTAPGSLGDFLPSRPPDARIARGTPPAAPAVRPGPNVGAPPDAPVAPPAPATPDEPPPGAPARKYIGRLR